MQRQTTILHTGTGGSVTTLCARYRNALSPTTSTPLVSGWCSGAPAFDFVDQQIKTFSGLCVLPTVNDIGATLVTRNCGRGTSALWNFQNVGSSQKRLVHSATGLCIEIGSAQLGDTPTLQLCSTSTRQRFSFNNGLIVPAGQNAVCFNVFTGLARTGLTVGLWDGCGGAENSFFHGSGRVGSGGQCLNMLGGVAFNGVQVGMAPCSNRSNEIWDFRL